MTGSVQAICSLGVMTNACMRGTNCRGLVSEQLPALAGPAAALSDPVVYHPFKYIGYGTLCPSPRPQHQCQCSPAPPCHHGPTPSLLQFLNEFMVEQKREAPGSPLPIIATKFAPQPWRFTSASVVEACKASLRRLGLPSMGLYMQHW